jgi:1-acyl-sn-glycerol-3-phosphate acyltransferase
VTALRFLRTVLGWALIVADTLTSALAIGLSGESQFSERVLRAWARRFLLIAGARVVVRRDAELDPERSYVFVSNHTSNLDVPAILSVMDGHPMRFIAKQELARIPIFGWAARRMGHIFIDRNLRGASLFFFAEGTRSVSDELLPFKKGAAVAALETRMDCVPIAVAGAREVLKPKGFSLFQPGPVAVVFGKPIASSSHALDRRDELVAEQRTAVEGALQEARALIAKEA